MILLIFLLFNHSWAQTDHFYQQRVEVLNDLVSEIKRLDGEALPIKNKSDSGAFDKIVIDLIKQMKLAKDRKDMGQVFRKLDAAYPNLHAKVYLDKSLFANPERVPMPVDILPSEVKKGQKKFEFRIANVNHDKLKELKAWSLPAIGDIVLEIQDIKIEKLFKEHLLYCKYPLVEQCALTFRKNATSRGIVLPFNETVSLKLKRNDLIFETKLPWVGTLEKNPSDPSGSGEEISVCEEQIEAYPSWKVRYHGFNICLLEKAELPNVYMLRIRSFAYRNIPENEKIKSLADEVGQFVENFWKKEAPTAKKIIFDLQWNGGGDEPVAWYKIFFPFPFLEQFYQQKNIAELENDEIRKNVFYGDPAKEIWYQSLLTHKKIGKKSDFLPAIPQFCPDETKSCDQGAKYVGEDYGFKGKIVLLTDFDCNSTCSGVVWQFKDKLKKRVKIIGIPDSGDTNYARVYIDIYALDKAPFYQLKTLGRKGGSRNNPTGADAPLIRQVVSVTRTTDSRGTVISGRPTPVDIWIQKKYRYFEKSYDDILLEEALKN